MSGKVKKDSLGDRMKRYEGVSKSSLVYRMPVVLRLDGVHFHTFTRGFNKPFDDVLIKSMQETMKYLCENIQGCVLGYTQSDEITLVLVDYKKINSSAWFDNEVQKMCSVASSMASMYFNRVFYENANNYTEWRIKSKLGVAEANKLEEVYKKAISKGAYFDCRAFNVPKEDVCNCVLWRQQDATRNSIQSLAQSQFSHKELQNKNCNELQDMLHEQKGINWNDLDVTKKRGSCCVRVEETFIPNGQNDVVTRMKWIIDNEIPIFTQDREYIEKWINI